MAILFNIKHESLANGTIESDSPITEGEDLNVTVMVDENTIDFDIDWDGLVAAGTYPNYVIFSPPAGDYTFTLTVEDAFGRTKDITEDVSVVAPSWVTHFNNSDWAAAIGSWSGTYWEDDFGLLDLTPLGTWTDSYRPTKMRIACSAGLNVELYDTAPALVGSASPYTPNAEINLSLGSYDISELSITGPPGFTVTNIEFLS